VTDISVYESQNEDGAEKVKESIFDDFSAKMQ